MVNVNNSQSHDICKSLTSNHLLQANARVCKENKEKLELEKTLPISNLFDEKFKGCRRRLAELMKTKLGILIHYNTKVLIL